MQENGSGSGGSGASGVVLVVMVVEEIMNEAASVKLYMQSNHSMNVAWTSLPLGLFIGPDTLKSQGRLSGDAGGLSGTLGYIGTSALSIEFSDAVLRLFTTRKLHVSTRIFILLCGLDIYPGKQYKSATRLDTAIVCCKHDFPTDFLNYSPLLTFKLQLSKLQFFLCLLYICL